MPAFTTIDEEQLVGLAARFGCEHHPAGATIVEEGDLGDELYVIVRGTVEVVQRGADGVAPPAQGAAGRRLLR
jgi:CRP-like cAMP-binding protein